LSSEAQDYGNDANLSTRFCGSGPENNYMSGFFEGMGIVKNYMAKGRWGVLSHRGRWTLLTKAAIF
jgi:hypothetical protein